MNALQALEARLASNATHTRSGSRHFVQVNCSAQTGEGHSLDEAVLDLLRKLGLEPRADAPPPPPPLYTSNEVKLIRDLMGVSMTHAKEGLVLARTEPRLKGDVVAGVMTRDAAALAVFVKRDRPGWNIAHGLEASPRLRAANPELDAAFPLPKDPE